MLSVRQLAILGVALGALLAASACSPRFVSRGYYADEEKSAAIAVGVDTKRSVRDRLGSPTLISTFDSDIWYYITSRESQVAWRLPETVKQEVIEIHFNLDGQVAEVVRHSEEDMQQVALVREETATRGRELTFWEQMFGSIGRGALGGGPSGNGPPGSGR